MERAGCHVVYANEIDLWRRDIYAANLDIEGFSLGDIRQVRGADVPDVEVATASFPCTDLSLAGNRAGLSGKDSALVSEFLRIIGEMKQRKPPSVLLENVIGFATSNGGEDLSVTIDRLNQLGYVCDVLTLDARRFVPQSRPRLFVIGIFEGMQLESEWVSSELHPPWLMRFANDHQKLGLNFARLPDPPLRAIQVLDDIVEHFRPTHSIWWDARRLNSFLSSLRTINIERLARLKSAERFAYAAAYRRTRNGDAVWEIRADNLAGCLRPSRGGSSRQALVEGGRGDVRVRWMTAREYARLQGVPELKFGNATETQAKFALGDAVCVPAIEWLAKNYLIPAIRERAEPRIEQVASINA
jgi:DNA (cytosine-5)-methyltransferase 1